MPELGILMSREVTLAFSGWKGDPESDVGHNKVCYPRNSLSLQAGILHGHEVQSR